MLESAKQELRGALAAHPETRVAYAFLLDAMGNPLSVGGLDLLKQTIDALRPHCHTSDSIGRAFGWLSDCLGGVEFELKKPKAKPSQEIVVTDVASPTHPLASTPEMIDTRDWESELTGNGPFDEGRYIESEYSGDEQYALMLGYPSDWTRSEIDADLYAQEEGEGDDFDEPEEGGEGDFDEPEEGEGDFDELEDE